MRTPTLIAMLIASFLVPVALRAQDQPSPSQPPDKPQPRPQQLPPPSHLARANGASGTWRAENVAYPPWTLKLSVDGHTVTGTVSQGAVDSVRGRQTNLTGPVEIYNGVFDEETIAFKCKSPAGGDRTITFSGTISDDQIDFIRVVQVREGGDPGDDGIFGASGVKRFTAKRETETSESQPPKPPESQPPKPPESQPPKPVPEPPNTAPKKDEPLSTAQPAATSDAVYDPFHAAQDMDVGKFYMHKGDADAAIDRFKHAITLKPNFAEPRMYLGELYEKKGDTAQAIRYYKEFLQILPDGPESKKVRKRLEKLTNK